jgi:hypothetical protein
VTKVRMDLSRPDETGIVANVGTVRCTPWTRWTTEVTDGTTVVLAAELAHTLTDPPSILELRATDADMPAWVFDEDTPGGIQQRVCAVPTVDDDVIVDYADLVLLDPDTFDPVAVPEAAWWAELEENLDDIDASKTAAETAQGLAEEAQAAAEAARDETIITVDGSSDWTGAVALDATAVGRSRFYRRRLTGNVTLTLAAGVAGQAYTVTLRLAQDATGGRTLKVANAATAYAVAPVLSTAANAVDLVHLLWTGSSWTCLVAAQALAIPSSWVV